MAELNMKCVGITVFAVLLTASCAGRSTGLKQTHIDETFTKKPVSDILVIGVAHQEDSRRLFEQRFVAALKAAGVDAVGSIEAVGIPSDMELKKEEILRAVERYGSDSVIITYRTAVEHKDAYTRGDGLQEGYYGRYGLLNSYAYDPGFSTERTTLWLETELYDVATESRIWSAQSISRNVESERQVIADVIKTTVAALMKSGVVAPK